MLFRMFRNFIILLLNIAIVITTSNFEAKTTLENSNCAMAMGNSAKMLYALEFEVFGKVQGVFFRKHTEKKAKEFGLHGWCMNTPQGTVKGVVEGRKEELESMKHWLAKVGSPKSRIDNANFSDLRELDNFTHKSFAIRR